MARIILLDADILCYQIASNMEKPFEFNGQFVLHADLPKGIREVENSMQWILDKLDGDEIIPCLTGKENFRKEVLPSYKGNRSEVRKPMILKGLEDHLLSECGGIREDILEGDDLIGIWATEPSDDERVIYSADKDLKTVPGLHWDPEDGHIIEITQDQADRFFYEQILTGDPTDNYSGCPGVGPKGAAELLDHGVAWDAYVHTFKSGPRKGEGEKRWRKVPAQDEWDSVVSAYQKAGLTEDDAIQQARCAHILQYGDYSFLNQEVTLWTP